MKRIRLLYLIASVLFLFRPQHTTAQEAIFPQVVGWKLAPEEMVYTPNNLFDAIDGAADLYLEYNFVNLHVGLYTKDELEIKVELYRHASALDAFGIFSQERFADYRFIDLGVQGYLEEGALNFLAGAYYVKLSTIQQGPAAQDALLLIARAVERHLHQSKAWPAMLAAFPAAKMQAYSEQYVSKNFLGYGSLNGVYIAVYDDGALFKAFVIKCGAPEQAIITLSNFENALPKNATRKESGGKTEILDPNNGRVEIVLKGSYIFGVVGPEPGSNHDAFLNEFEQNLSSLK